MSEPRTFGLAGSTFFAPGAFFLTVLVMALLQRYELPYGQTLFGVVSAACFFLPGLKYYRQRLRKGREH